MRHALNALADKIGTLLSQFAAQCFDHADKFHAGLPGEKFLDVFFDDGLGAGNFASPGITVLLDDLGKVVEVVEIGSGRFNVARQAQVHYEQRAVAARRHGLGQHRAFQCRLLRGNAGNDNVRQSQCGVPILPTDHFAGEFPRQQFRTIPRAIHYIEMRNVAVAELRNYLLADGAGPQNQGCALAELAEDAFRELYAGGGNRHRACAEFRFVADSLADLQCALKHAIENRAGRAGFMGQAVGFSNLAENLRLAEDHGVKARGHAKQVANGMAVVAVVERRAQVFRLYGVEPAEVVGQHGGGLARTLRWHAINLAAIAGGEHQRLVKYALGPQFRDRLARLIRRERHTLSDLDWSRAVVQSDQHNFHGADCVLLEIAMRVREKQVYHGKTENHDREIEDTKLRGARSAPAGITRQPQIDYIGHQHQQGDDVFRIVVPDSAAQPVDPNKPQRRANGNGDQPDQHAALAHAIEQVERRQTPHDAADFVLLQQALLGEIDDAQHARKAERGVGQNAKRDVKRESHTFGRNRGVVVGSGGIGKQHKCQDKRKNQRSDRALTVEELQAQIGQREQPAKQGHGSGKVMIGNRVQAARSLEQRVIVRYQPARQQQRGHATRPFAARYQEPDVAGETAQIGRKCKQEKEMVHGFRAKRHERLGRSDARSP